MELFQNAGPYSQSLECFFKDYIRGIFLKWQKQAHGINIERWNLSNRQMVVQIAS